MKKYAILVTILVATCLVGITLSRAQREPKATADDATDVNSKIQQLSSSDPAQRASAACALGKMGAKAESAIPALIKLLDDGTVVDAKLVCYGEYFSYDNIEPEFAGLKEPSPGEAAVQALIRLSHPSVEPLLVALKDSQWRTRKNAAWALLHLRDTRAFKPLVEALSDEAWQVRANAAAALGEQRGQEVLTPLTGALRDPNAAVRWSAASSLGLIEDPRAVEALLIALKDEHQRTRANAARSLGLIRDPRAVPSLIEALKDGDGQLRMNAATALGHIRDERAIAPLTGALKDESAQVRGNAQRALEEIRPR